MPQQLAQWLSQPFNSDMSALRWFLFIGLLLALLVAWHLIYREFTVVEADL